MVHEAAATWDLLQPGTWLIFGVVFLPVYVMMVAWFVGKPRTVRKALMGMGYVLGITIGMWGALFLKTILINFVFFSGM